ncbi:MAG: peptidoglycan DD-metalloendopeptidase family protein [Gammaproteobacteria bacterium]|nr:peptidoglycan DD-metalloendopeptidase family protein [Gammaproteobacteria bacterium]
MMIKFILLFAAASFYFFINTAIAFPEHHPVPGGTVVIELSSADTPQPRAFYKKQKVAVHKYDDAWYAMIGISLNTKPGRYEVNYQFDDKKQYHHSFVIKNKTYKAQYLTVKNKRKVNPTAEDMKRIVKERQIKKAAKNTWSDQTVHSDFIRPVDGRISSIFGLRRFFNQQARRPHSGLDIAAPQGTPVKAIADARVIETGDFFFSGNMIYLDHGQGVISLYAHLYKTHVKPGQLIKQGDIIGEVGETGRVTGPHLHLSLLLNRTAVDPDHWLPAVKAQ